MFRHLARIVGITALILLCTFYPLFPGPYDALALTLSTIAQAVTLAGLLLVPIGTVWVVSELRPQTRITRQLAQGTRAFYFALSSLIVGVVIATAVSLAAFFAGSLAIALAMAALCLFVLLRLSRMLKLLQSGDGQRVNPAPFYLVIIPCAAIGLQIALAKSATEYSRNFAIARSTTLINDIENYHAANGYYPRSLSALHQDYDPRVVGIAQYHYAPNGDAYNLFFEQPRVLLDALGVREIVMFNGQDQHDMVSHDSDILRWTPEQLRTRRGWNSIHETSIRHWKYFYFD